MIYFLFFVEIFIVVHLFVSFKSWITNHRNLVLTYIVWYTLLVCLSSIFFYFRFSLSLFILLNLNYQNVRLINSLLVNR